MSKFMHSEEKAVALAQYRQQCTRAYKLGYPSLPTRPQYVVGPGSSLAAIIRATDGLAAKLDSLSTERLENGRGSGLSHP
jgi:hypothetical protein